MIRDKGIAEILRRAVQQADGDLPQEQTQQIYKSWYGERVIGMSRYYTARQAGDRIDLLIRLLAPCDHTLITADDVCMLRGIRYRILQAQYLRDEESGEECVDLSLERIES